MIFPPRIGIKRPYGVQISTRCHPVDTIPRRNYIDCNEMFELTKSDGSEFCVHNLRWRRRQFEAGRILEGLNSFRNRRDA